MRKHLHHTPLEYAAPGAWLDAAVAAVRPGEKSGGGESQQSEEGSKTETPRSLREHRWHRWAAKLITLFAFRTWNLGFLYLHHFAWQQLSQCACGNPSCWTSGDAPRRPHHKGWLQWAEQTRLLDLHPCSVLFPLLWK